MADYARESKLSTLPRSLVIAIVALAVPLAFGQYEINWSTIDGGGATSSGGGFTLTGTIGQPDAGAMTGGGYELQGGFWVGIGCPGDLDGDGMVGLSDLSGLLSNFGSLGATAGDGDLDGDHDVDLADLSGMLALFGTTCA